MSLRKRSTSPSLTIQKSLFRDMNFAFFAPVSLPSVTSPPSRPVSFHPSRFSCLPRPSNLLSSPRPPITATLSTHLSLLATVFPLLLFPSASPPPSQQQTTHSHHPNSHAQTSSVSTLGSPSASASASPHAPLAIVAPHSSSSSSHSPSDPSSLKLAASSITSASIRQRLSFYLSEFLMWHPGAKVLSLFTFTLIVMYLGSFLYRCADPKREEAQYPFWHSVRAVANPLEDDWQKNSLRAASITLASFGMIVFAILIGTVTETVESAVQNADGENTHVVVSDHVLVCGWSAHVAQILKDVASVSPNTKVVVLAPAHKKSTMQSDLRSTIPESTRQNLRVFYRPGVPTMPQDLERVGAARARKILLVKPRRTDPVDADRVTLSRALALRQNLPGFQGDVVAELNTVRDESIVKAILARSHARSVQTINTEQLLFRFMAQAIRQPGLADVVALLMGDDPASVFHVMTAGDVAPELVGKQFSDLRPTSVSGAILCGFVDASGQVVIENGTYAGSNSVTPDSKLLLLGRGKSHTATSLAQKGRDKKQDVRETIQLSSATSSMMQTAFHDNGPDVSGRGHTRAENFLVLGWRHDMDSMLLELDSMLPGGSTVTVVDHHVPDRITVPMKRVRVHLIRKRADRYETIESLMQNGSGKKQKQSQHFDHVVVIGSANDGVADVVDGDATNMESEDGDDDAKALATLVYVNDVIGKQQNGRERTVKSPLVTVEFLNEDVAEMAREQGGVANAILPQNLGAKIAAQTVRDNRLNGVWRELLSQVGREVYLRPAGMYNGVTGERASFSTVADRIAKSDDDIVIGYIPRFMPKVKINPQASDRFGPRVWDANDTLIVLSKD